MAIQQISLPVSQFFFLNIASQLGNGHLQVTAMAVGFHLICSWAIFYPTPGRALLTLKRDLVL